MALSLISCAGISFLFYIIGKNVLPQAELPALLAGLIYAVAPSTISSVMLTRMYAFSTMWTVLYTLIFVLLVKNYYCTNKQFVFLTIAGAFTCYCAFLTHYYALFVPFFLTAFYCLYALFQRKQLLRMFLYGVSMLLAIGLGICTYPACIEHIFNGYRGKGAISDMIHDTLFGRTKIFLTWLNSSVLAGWLIPCIIVFLAFFVLGIILLICKKKTPASKIFIFSMISIVISSMLSFWLLTKFALMVGEDASRYFYPVIGIVLPFIAYTIAAVVLLIKDFLLTDKLQASRKVVEFFITAIILVAILLPIAHTYHQDKVLFLYKEDAEKVSFSQEHKEYPLIMVYSSDVRYRSWYVDNQLWPFERVFYVEYDYIPEIKDPLISSAEKIVVYMDGPEEALQQIIEDNPNLNSCRLIRHEPFFYVYLLE